MGLLDIDSIVGAGISAAEDTLDGKGEEQKEKNTFFGILIRFIVTIIWFVITFVVSLGAFYAMWAGSMIDFLGGDDGMSLCYLAIGASFLVFLITFIIPYLRKKGTLTRWLGIVALGDALWWIYILIKGF